jgi:hypothetical protein
MEHEDAVMWNVINKCTTKYNIVSFDFLMLSVLATSAVYRKFTKL